MIVKNWITEAADKIYHGDRGDHYDTSPRVIAEVIAEHCPMEPDTVYMPVPRCDTCKWWEPRPDDHYEKVDQTGECTSKLGPWSDCGDYTILTGNDFGCVRWSAKA